MPVSAAVTVALAPSMAPTRMPQSDGRCCTGFWEPTQDIRMRSSHARGLGHRPVSTSTSERGRSQDRPLACGALRPTAIVSTPELTIMCYLYSHHKAKRWRCSDTTAEASGQNPTSLQMLCAGNVAHTGDHGPVLPALPVAAIASDQEQRHDNM